MTKNARIILFIIIALGITGLVLYGLFSSKMLDNHKEKGVKSNIEDYLYDESKDTLELEEEDLDDEEAIVEDDDFEVYEEEGDWDEEAPDVPKAAAEENIDGKLEELYDNTPIETTREVINEEEDKASPPLSKGKYLVIAGSFKSKRNAEKKVRALEKKGFSGTIVQLKGSKLQTVVAGRFSSEMEAKELADEVEDSGLRAIVKMED